jgi:hypothetical protein
MIVQGNWEEWIDVAHHHRVMMWWSNKRRIGDIRGRRRGYRS